MENFSFLFLNLRDNRPNSNANPPPTVYSLGYSAVIWTGQEMLDPARCDLQERRSNASLPNLLERTKYCFIAGTLSSS